MAVTMKMDPIDRDIALLLDIDMGPEARSQALAAFAREQLADAQKANAAATGGEVPPHQTFVDGRNGVPLESVQPDGTIVFVFDLVNDVLEWIGAQLVKASPVLTGEYARSHILLADDVEVSVPGPIPPASTYVFVNTQPYSGKIERGLSAQATEGVFQAVAVMAKSRFSGTARIKFTFWSIDSAPRGGDRHERSKRGMTKAVIRVPAIMVTLFGAR